MPVVVGDIHGDIEKAQAFLGYKPEAEHVALGDYLDSFTLPFEQQVECLNLLMDSRAVLLLGNHECHYLKHPLFQFAGYQQVHAAELQDLMEYNLFRFKAAHVADGWLCTHAGVNSRYTERQTDVTVLAEMFNSSWQTYLNHRKMDHDAQYLYQSIFCFNYRIYVEGNLLPTNIKQIFGHVQNTKPIVEPHFIALDTTNHTDSCWLYDTGISELVELPLEPKIGRVRFQGGGWL
jgi:hypothetical protein